jgi:hypothetical protein
MSKKPAKRTTTAKMTDRVEAENRRELATLRRVRNQQRQLVALSRQITALVRRASVVRVVVARELLEGSEYGVFGIAQWDEMESAVTRAEKI